MPAHPTHGSVRSRRTRWRIHRCSTTITPIMTPTPSNHMKVSHRHGVHGMGWGIGAEAMISSDAVKAAGASVCDNDTSGALGVIGAGDSGAANGADAESTELGTVIHRDIDQGDDPRSGTARRTRTSSHNPCRHAGDNRRLSNKIETPTMSASNAPFQESASDRVQPGPAESSNVFMVLQDLGLIWSSSSLSSAISFFVSE